MVNYDSGYQVLIGWNVEIIVTFLFWSLIITKSIPEDKNKTFFGINNRIVLAFCWGVLPVIIEIIYDLPTTKQQATAVGIMAGILFLGFAIFLPLGWI